jgi:thermopsin
VLKRLQTFLVVVLLVLPILALQSLPIAHAQGETEYESQQLLPARYYNYTAITLQNTSIIGYATSSNVSIDTAFMTGQQLAAFNQTCDITDSVFYQTAEENYDALLETPGTYYLVVYTPDANANISQIYIINQDIDLHNSTSEAGLFITIPPGLSYSIPLHVETLGSSSQVDIVGASSEVVQYGLENRLTHSLVFNSQRVTVTNFTVSPTVSIGYNLSLGPGLYVMRIQNESPESAYVYFQYAIAPAYVNPFILLNGPPSPTGVAAYGIYNRSGTVTPYKIATSSIVGFADISMLTAKDNGSSSTEASLQENAVLQVNNTDGESFTYWPQNVLDFDTGGPTVAYRDNVLNITGDGAELTNQSIVGKGTSSTVNNTGIEQTYYGNYNSNYTYTYTLPQAWVLYMNETVTQGQGVTIQMGIRALGGSSPARTTWYDTIKIADPQIASASFIVDGKEYTPAGANIPIGSYYDAELVFGGGAGGQAATFQVNADLALFYLDQTLKPFPSLYTFGDDTAEAAYNIRIANGSSVATATTGNPYYGILTNNFSASLPSLSAKAANGTSITPIAPSSSPGFLIAAVVIVGIILIAFAVVLRKRESRIPMEQPAPYFVPAQTYCPSCGAPFEPGARFCANCGAPREAPPETPSDARPGV